MSFREKSAWIVFTTVLIVFGSYFGVMGYNVIRGVPGYAHGYFPFFVVCVVVLVILQIIGHVLAALAGPTDANAPADERDRLVDMKAANIALPVLGASCLLAIGTIQFGIDTPGLANLVLLALVIGTLTEYGAKIYFFRAAI